MDYPQKQLAVDFSCNFHNDHAGEVAQYLGHEGTVEVSPVFCRFYDAELNPENQKKSARFCGRAAVFALAEPDRFGAQPAAPALP